MKRPTKHKINDGPATPRNRAEKKKKAQEFIADCEKSLIRLIVQKSREKECRWIDLEQELHHRSALLRKSYPNYKGRVSIAVRNVEQALKTTEEKETKGNNMKI
jgi:hypothetical protein